MKKYLFAIMREKMETLRDLSYLLHLLFEDKNIHRHYFKMWCFWSNGDESKYDYEFKKYNKKLIILLDFYIFPIKEIMGLFNVAPFSNINNLSMEQIKNLHGNIAKFQRVGVFDEDVMDILKSINRKLEEIKSWRISRTDYKEIIENLKFILDEDELELEDLKDVNMSLKKFIDNNRERYENSREIVKHINEIIDEARKVIYGTNDRKKEEIFESYFDQNANLWQDVTTSYNDLNQNKLKKLESYVCETVEKIL